jgi:hypothetical protein
MYAQVRDPSSRGSIGRKIAFAVGTGAGIALLLNLAACPGPKTPSGPPPEYEEPPAPSWLRDAGQPEPAPPVQKPVPGDDAGAQA